MKKIVQGVLLFAAVGFALGLMVRLARGEELKPMPETGLEPPVESLNKILPKPPSLGEGLAKVATPKFFFGVGLVVTIVAGLFKLAIVVVIGLFVFYFFRARKQHQREPDKDFVDTLVEAFADTVAKLRSERDKRATEVAKLDAAFNKLGKGVAKAIKK